MAFSRVAVTAASCALFVAACSADAGRGGCSGGEKCPGPAPPNVTVHLGIGGASALLDVGGAAHAFAKRGRPTTITVSIERPANVTVSNVWLDVQTSHNKHGQTHANAPFSHYIVVLDRQGVLRSTDTLSATWIPTPQPGSDQVNLGITMTVGDTGAAWQIATVTV